MCGKWAEEVGVEGTYHGTPRWKRDWTVMK